MTTAQRTYYIGAALKAYRVHHAPGVAEKPCSELGERDETFDEFRHRLVAEALGQSKSFAAFSNADLDKVLAHFKLYAEPDSFAAALEEVNAGDDGHRRRLLFAIEEQTKILGLPYVWKVAAGKFRLPGADHNVGPHDYLDQLDLDQLEQLRFTLAARARSHQQRREPCTTSTP